MTSLTLVSPAWYCTVRCFCWIRSCTHNHLDCMCFVRETPSLEANALAAVLSFLTTRANVSVHQQHFGAGRSYINPLEASLEERLDSRSSSSQQTEVGFHTKTSSTSSIQLTWPASLQQHHHQVIQTLRKVQQSASSKLRVTPFSKGPSCTSKRGASMTININHDSISTRPSFKQIDIKDSKVSSTTKTSS
eukprot:6466249-Amphidinium_carterae.2